MKRPGKTSGCGAGGALFMSGIFVKRQVGKTRTFMDEESTGIVLALLALLHNHGICIDTGRGYSCTALVRIAEMGKTGKEVEMVLGAMKPRPGETGPAKSPGKRKGRKRA